MTKFTELRIGDPVYIVYHGINDFTVHTGHLISISLGTIGYVLEGSMHNDEAKGDMTTDRIEYQYLSIFTDRHKAALDLIDDINNLIEKKEEHIKQLRDSINDLKLLQASNLNPQK